MWIAAAAGVDRDGEQGVASGMASTTLNVGNAVGLAILIAGGQWPASSGLAGEPLRAAMTAGVRLAFLLAAGGILAGLRRRPRPAAAALGRSFELAPRAESRYCLGGAAGRRQPRGAERAAGPRRRVMYRLGMGTVAMARSMTAQAWCSRPGPDRHHQQQRL